MPRKKTKKIAKQQAQALNRSGRTQAGKMRASNNQSQYGTARIENKVPSYIIETLLPPNRSKGMFRPIGHQEVSAARLLDIASKHADIMSVVRTDGSEFLSSLSQDVAKAVFSYELTPRESLVVFYGNRSLWQTYSEDENIEKLLEMGATKVGSGVLSPLKRATRWDEIERDQKSRQTAAETEQVIESEENTHSSSEYGFLSPDTMPDGESLSNLSAFTLHEESTATESRQNYGNSETKIIPGNFIALTNSVWDRNPNIDWTGSIPEHIRDWINLRFYASMILNICYIGRGAPTGVDIRDKIEWIASDQSAMREFLSRFTSERIIMPEFDMSQHRAIPLWQQDDLWNLRFRHEYQHALKKSENFREKFEYLPTIYQDPQIDIVYLMGKDIEKLLRGMLISIKYGKENNVPDIIWNADNIDEIISQFEEMGAITLVELVLSGLSVETLFL